MLVAGLVLAVAAGAIASPSHKPSRKIALPGHPPALNPLGAIQQLNAQRAGYGSPRHAALLAARADAKARALRSRPVPAPAGGPNLSVPWSALGPEPINPSFYGGPNTGRVDSIAVASNGTIFEGSAGGGIWSSTDGGATWTQHTDDATSGLAIGAITVDPTNPNTIYAGTGEANNSADSFYGGGVLKSTDGGAHWTVENQGGLFTGTDFFSIAVDPNTPTKLYAGTTNGFFVSTDSGVTWARPTGTGDFTSRADGVVLDPTSNPTTVYVGTEGVGIQKSTDGGANFSTVTGGGAPTGATVGVTALGIGSGAAGHSTLYAAVQLNGTTDANGGSLSMYKTTNGGGTWSKLTIPAYTNQSYAYGSGTGDQASYDNTIAVDPTNASHVVAAGIAPVETTDGGSTWSNINGQSFFAATSTSPNVFHPDFHATTFTSTGVAFIGNDGGIYKYTGGGRSGVSDLNSNQGTTQAYEDLGVYQNGSQILGGFQDNGTNLYTGNPTWPDVWAGDGGYSAINPLDANQQFLVGNQHPRMTADAWATTNTDITPPGGTAGANFTPPMTIAPNTSSPDSPTVFYGGADLWRTINPTASPPTWTQVTTVGAKVSAIAVAPSSTNVVYVGFDNGTLEVSTDGGATFTNLNSTVFQWITHINVDPSNPGSIELTFSDNNTHTSPQPPVVQAGNVTLGTTTPSATYTDITGNLPRGAASNSIVNDGGTLVVATDVGVFMTNAPNGTSTQWSAAGIGLPNVQVLGLTVDGNGDLFAATHGRGVWKLVPGPGAGQHTLTVTKGGTGSGTVTSNPSGINCGSTCQANFSTGQTVTLTATPAAGSSFAGWSGAGCSGTGPCTVTMSADQTITATFTASPPPVTHTLSVALAGNGAGTVTGNGIQCPGTCSNTYPAGTQVTLVASPAGGSSFAGWNGGGCSGTGQCVVSMSSNQTVTATFNSLAPQPSCTLSHHGNGVYVGPKRGHRHKRRHPKKGVLKLTVRCDQNVDVGIAGTIRTTFRRRHRKFSLTFFSSAGAGRAETLNVKLPNGAVRLLARGARESASFVLVASNGNGVGLASTSIGRLRALRW